MNKKEKSALDMLHALLGVPGALQIITAEHACGIDVRTGKSEPEGEAERAICAAHPYPPSDPRHFVCAAVIGIGEPDERGVVRAYSEADWMEGLPSALLIHLQRAFQAIGEAGGG